jgi:hypothetical protein
MSSVIPQSEIRSLYGNVNKIFLVDSSWLLHKSFYGYPDYSVMDETTGIITPTGDIHGFLIGVLMMIRRCPDAAIILCLDSRENDRKKEFPEYKSGREHKPEIVSKLFEIIHSASLFPNVYLSAHLGYEADDVIHTLSKMFYDRTGEILMYARDKDIMQNVNDKVCMWNKCDTTGKHDFLRIKSEEVEKTFEGCKPPNTPFFRSVCGGDSSDNLKAGYPYFPHKLAVRIANECGCPDKFLQTGFACAAKEQKWVDKLIEKPDPLLSMYSLMKSRFIPELKIYRSVPTGEYITRYKLNGVQRDFERFLPFAEREYCPLIFTR